MDVPLELDETAPVARAYAATDPFERVDEPLPVRDPLSNNRAATDFSIHFAAGTECGVAESSFLDDDKDTETCSPPGRHASQFRAITRPS